MHLTYVFWEPLGPPPREVAEHRDEVKRFSELVEGDPEIAFTAVSYHDLWSEWDGLTEPGLEDHLGRLRGRYAVGLE